MKLFTDKGQMGSGAVVGMILLLIVSFVGIISITVYSSIETSVLTSQTGVPAFTVGNFSSNTYAGYTLSSVIPIVIAAGLILTIIIAFAVFARG